MAGQGLMRDGRAMQSVRRFDQMMYHCMQGEMYRPIWDSDGRSGLPRWTHVGMLIVTPSFLPVLGHAVRTNNITHVDKKGLLIRRAFP